MRRLRARRRPARPSSGTRALLPLVDVVTILLVFLLRAYSADPPVRPGDAAFVLPVSASETPLAPALAVDVTATAIELDGERTASTVYYLDHDEELIEDLYARLQARDAAAVQVRVDAAVPYRVTRKVLASCQRAGVERLTLVARSRASL